MTDPQDRAQVLDLLARFAHGIDGRDWALYRSVFADDVDVDYPSYRPGSVGRTTADAWVERGRRLFPGLDATQHLLANAWLQRDAGEVVVRTSMRADHFLDGARYTLGGSYEHRVRRGEDGERVIAGVTLTVTWREGDEGMLAVAAARVASA